MRKFKMLLLNCIVLFSVTSCFDDLDDNIIPSSTLELNDFVWKGMNAVYVYKDLITELGNDNFETTEQYQNYLNGFDSPENLFESLLYEPDTVDEFSRIYSNYFELEQLLQGTSLNNGMAYGLVRIPNANEDIIGYVRYVMPNTDAETKGVTRGMIFNSIDGTVLTADNYINLTSATTYTINLADYDNNGTPGVFNDDIISTNNEAITLTKSAYTENPILTHNVLNVESHKIGYLMYNNFRIADANLDELNTVFGEFDAEGISDLVLDLRYNGGGSVSTAIWLSSMITGQYTGELFFKEKWNNEIQSNFEANNLDAITNTFVDTMIKRNTDNDIIYQQSINSLNLNKVYIITSASSASASELVINCLTPYIDIVQIGTTTRGKPQASITIYDSPDFTRSNVNINHNYALQPLIYESENADGFSQYYDGISPTNGFEIGELFENLGQLSDIDEPLLAMAIADITGLSRAETNSQQPLKHIGNQNSNNPLVFDMVDNRASKFKLFNQ
ncbi:carboxyl-terminal protease [Winogradskyella litoriviva]|uniref:Carboxyl-terminal protease n=1 Tax=Winogradskyella litoriviva TaxID=1220182 RepID=A0ABX2E7A3_9FLAO|nr:S41 family peptidase [Winogradskyella litoriviva]NRD24027.1 carboxyl-terminal protease [Winogradskyella litoriviva]